MVFVFLISNSTCSLLVYKKVMDFDVKLINFVSCNLALITYFQECFVDCLDFPVEMIMSSVNKDSFVSSSPICIPVISFSY